jgi:peptidoglycan L-alanyl-D-glutamate endopeptidase CwlK
MAVDVSPYPVPPWKAIEDFAFFGGYVLGIAHGLYLKKKMIHKIRFGGDWDGDQRISDEHFQDLLHFELIK